MFRGSGAGAASGPPAASGGSSGGGGGGGVASTSSASSTMLNFARALGMGKGGSGGHGPSPGAPPPADLPNPTTPPGAGDTSSVFYVDDTLSEMARVKRYSLSQLPLQRLVYVKRIAACARSVGLSEAIAQLLPLFPKLAADHEAVVRTAAAAELANVAHMLADPNVPYNQQSTNSMLNSNTTSKPPSTAQSADLTLEDEQLVEIPEVNDVSQVLPASLPPAAAAAALTGAAPTAADGAVPAAEAAAIVAAAATVNPDAMDVDDSVAVAPAADEAAADAAPAAKDSQPDGDTDGADDADSSVPMDVSETADADSEEQREEEQAAAEAAAAIPVPSAAPGQQQQQQQQQPQSEGAQSEETDAAAKPSSPVAAPAPAPAPTSPSSSSAPSSPLNAAASTAASAASPSATVASAPATATATATGANAHSPLSDPTSALRLESYEHIKDTVIPCLNTLILDGNAEVRAAACDALVRVADVLRGDDVGKVVLTLVLNLAHDERDEQRTTAVHLMHELAPRLGQDLCRSFVALELAAFADDSTFRVRKATAQSFGHVCAVVGESFTCSKLLPSYVRLSKDLIWGVRASCAKSLVAVTKVVGPATRAEVIIPMFERFAKDSSRWVRNGAYEILGPFLYALGPDLVSRELLALFAGIPSMSSAVVDQEVNYHAAFNLPAVLQTVGAERWPELSACFAALAKDTKFPVRRTLSYSLHELAALLGPALTEQSLLPALDAFLRDLDEVRYGVLKNFALLLRAITPAKRLAYLEVLWLVAKQNENWRWRLLWSKQLGAFAHLYDADRTVTDIRPLAFALCRDQVAAVRRTAALALGRLLVRFLSFATPNSVVAPLLADMHAFATSSTYMERQLYLRMVEGCVAQPALSADILEQFMQRALTLAADKTSNVRLACAHSMRNILAHPRVQQSAAARAIMQRLSADAHSEVRRTALEAVAAHATTVLAAELGAMAISNADSANANANASSDDNATATRAAAAGSTELSDADLDDILAGPASSAAASASSTAAASSAPPSPAASSATSTPDSPASVTATDSDPAAAGAASAAVAAGPSELERTPASEADGDADAADDDDGASPDQRAVALAASE